VPQALRDNPALWSGCLSGAFREDQLLQAFVGAGFHGVELLERQAQPWATVEGIEFRSVTVRAYRPMAVDAQPGDQEVVYRGPWAAVIDDAGRQLKRGIRTAVDASAAAACTREPFSNQVIVLTTAAQGRTAEPCCSPGQGEQSGITCCGGE
jgi:hypothetical protein